MGKCSFPGCNKPSHSLGLCGAHYQQHRLGKTLKPLQVQYHGLTERERFEKRVADQPNGCRYWLGSILKKPDRPRSEWHGFWRNSNGQVELTHRAAWRIYKGEIIPGALVLHICDNPRCVNIDHLYLGTQIENVRDMWSRGRANPGISRGEDHGNAKLTDEQVREIRSSRESGPTMAKRLGVSTATLYDIRNGKTWKHIK